MNTFESLHPGFTDLVDMDSSLELIEEGFQFTEGPVWHARENCLYFSDIPADTLFRFSTSKGIEIVHHPSGFSNGLTLDKAGNILYKFLYQMMFVWISIPLRLVSMRDRLRRRQRRQR